MILCLRKIDKENEKLNRSSSTEGPKKAQAYSIEVVIVPRDCSTTNVQSASEQLDDGQWNPSWICVTKHNKTTSPDSVSTGSRIPLLLYRIKCYRSASTLPDIQVFQALRLAFCY